MEYLETKGVPVIGFGTKELPAFYTRQSGFQVDYRIDTVEELAAAIDKENTHVVEICGKQMTVADIDYDICRTCKNGACKNRFAETSRPDRVAALCNRECICHLEEIGALENKFENAFRQREAWSVGGKGSVAGRDTESANVLGGQFSKDGNRGNR